MRKQTAHSIDRAINQDGVSPRFLGAIQKAWCAATGWEGSRNAYPADASNPARDQCGVTAPLVWAEHEFRGEIVPCLAWLPGAAEPVPHYQEREEGVTTDLTAQQFPPGTVIEQIEPGDSRHLEMLRGFFDESADRSLRKRMTLLLGRMMVLGDYQTDTSADYIVDRLQNTLQARFF